MYFRYPLPNEVEIVAWMEGNGIRGSVSTHSVVPAGIAGMTSWADGAPAGKGVTHKRPER